MRAFSQIMFVILLWMPATHAYANNTRFLPGDAFYYIRLNLKEIQKFQSVESPLFAYGNHWNGGFGCGYWGFDELQLLQMPAETRRALLETYRELQPEIEKNENLLGKMSVFVYNKDYDWQKYGLGLQYNENWLDESVDLGMSRDHARLESFVEKPSSINQNRKYSKEIPALKVKLPKRPRDKPLSWTAHPVRLNCAQCQLLIIPDREFDHYVHPRDGLKVIRIVDGKRSVFHCSKGKWVADSEQK
ncbi:hypothetical protein [Gimesia panareensis]|uniref:hypothetical protein n=1 Tax=Gimesia panareensis TaxID=2527978 RepID=UPI0011881A42|nr:hypothetical protein [Gimesia panareensis]QDU53080.1 hypothetical protein Pan110_54640 [Gimesia panareensis]